MSLPADLPARLRKHGLKVVEVPGWKTRGRPASTGGFAPVGVLCHHTATSKATPVDSVIRLLIDGRSDLPGPLCQLSLTREGVVYVVAAGRANHAGEAKPSGTVSGGDGNVLYIGIEAQNAGTGEPWPKAQYDAYWLLAAALCVEITHNSAQTVRGHKETSVTGKIDPAGPTPDGPTFDMAKFRSHVAAAIKAIENPAPQKPTPPPAATLTVIGWNCYVANSAANVTETLTRWAKEHNPDVFCLSEARTHAAALKKVPGYTVLQETPGPNQGKVVNDAGDSAILVRDGSHVRRSGVARMLLKWVVVGHKKTHTPRHYQRATLRHAGVKWRIRSSHWPTHGFKGANRRAFRESAVRSKAWLRLGLGKPSLDVGDLNEKVATLADWYGKQFLVVGSGIDMLVGRHVTAEHTELDKGGSDHQGQKYVVTAK